MKRSDYSNLLRDPRWQKKRLRILERDKWKCRICYHDDRELNVHHLVYASSGKPWDALDRDLLTTCQPCHKRVEDAIHLIRSGICSAFHLDDVELLVTKWTGMVHKDGRACKLMMKLRNSPAPTTDLVATPIPPEKARELFAAMRLQLTSPPQ